MTTKDFLVICVFVAGTVPVETAFAQTAPAAAASQPSRQVASAVPSTAEVTRPPAASAATATASSDQAIVLSPFEVREDEDQGYLATSAQSGTRLRSELKDIAASVSVVTKDFMNDIGARNLEDTLTYTLNTEVGGVSGNFSESVSRQTASGGEMNYDGAFESVAPGTRVRGLTNADSTREFFSTSVPLDGYNVERIEISRGPNAMLFGLGSPSGIINSSLIKADLRRPKTSLQYRTDQYGSYRGSLDHNQVLIRDKLALRFATVYDKAYYRIEPAYNQTKRGYLTGTFRPFKDTTIKASTEWGQINSNRPRISPPYDGYTSWWELGRPSYDLRSGTVQLRSTPTLISPVLATGARNNNVIVTTMGTSGGTNSMTLVYSDPNSSAPGIPGLTAVGYRSGQIAGVRRNPAGALVADGPMGLADMKGIINQIYANDITSGFWKSAQLTDPSIYNFYRNMLEGPDKFEWADWTTHNLTLEQHFLQNRAGVEIAFDRQNLDQGSLLPLQLQGYTIRVDINTYLPNGAPNPDFGRPFATGFQSNLLSAADRDAGRATGYYNLDLRRLGPKWLGQVLGTHLLTATHTRLENFDERYGATTGVNSGVDYSFANQGSLNDASTQGRNVSLLHYLGANASNSATPLGGLVTPTGQWTAGLASVPILWAPGAATIAGSPAVWETRTFNLLTNGRKDVNNTRRASGIRRTRTEINSSVFVTQDRWLEGKLVTTLGWRRDDVHGFDAGTARRDPVTGIGINDPAVLPLSRVSVVSERTFSWGAVGHAPNFIQRHLPFGTELSLTYNQADNFRPTGQRYDMYDNLIDPEVGTTKEHGILLSTFNGRLVFRAARYKTSAAYASVNLPVQTFADNVERVLDQNAKGANDANPAGIAAFDTWFQSPQGQAVRRTFRLVQSGTNWNYDRRTGQVTNTSDVVSEGDEFEVIINPTRRWRISLNAAKSVAVRSNTGRQMIDIVGSMSTMLAGPAGQLRQEDGGTLFGNAMRQGVVVPLLRVTTQDGSPTNELRRWRWNGVSNYRFTEGRLGGWNLGGAARWQDKVAIGFPVIVDPVAGPIPDVKHPFFGSTEINYDAWIGYSQKLRNRYAWNVQLNLKNIGVGDKLIPVNAQPDGSINAWRIAESMKWTLTNTFAF